MNGILLYIIATIIFPFASIANLIVTYYKLLKRLGWKALNSDFFNMAKKVDIFANELFPVLWNTLVRKEGGYEFGAKGETLSSALGKNQLMKKLSWFGWIIVLILWIIDVKYWWKGGHCINSIDK